VSDTPSGDAKAKAPAEDGRARANAGQDRDRRRGGRNAPGKGGDAERGDRSPRGDRPRRDRDRDRDRGGDRDRRSEQPLTAGLFAGVADREMPCRVAGCPHTWTWFGTQQIRSLGKPPPKRMCAEHLAEFEGIDDKAMPCRNTWCTGTWLWTRAAQLFQRERQDKLKPPHRLCEGCFEAEKHTEDLQIACKVPECEQTWTWDRHAQLRHRAWVGRQQAKLEAEEAEEDARDERAAASPASSDTQAQPDSDTQTQTRKRRRTRKRGRGSASSDGGEATASSDGGEATASSDGGEATASDGEATASSDGGEASLDRDGRAEAQEVEAAELADVTAGDAGSTLEREPSGDESESESESESELVHADAGSDDAGTDDDKSGRKRRRKRRRKRKIPDGPPEKLCERCFARLGHLEPIEVPCKVHGCTSTWTWERDGQLRAWAALDSQQNVTELPQPPRRMCNGCFEFVRHHHDREVACGRPGCDRTWTYKGGAQLQDFLAGRTRDPIRMCEECSRSQFMLRSARGVELPEGSEVMPCMVSACAGSWVYMPGMKLSQLDPDADEASEPPVDRMCDDCRSERGVEGRDPRRAQAGEGSAAEPDAGAGSDAAGTEVGIEVGGGDVLEASEASEPREVEAEAPASE
jgi:hypothetical protein